MKGMKVNVDTNIYKRPAYFQILEHVLSKVAESHDILLGGKKLLSCHWLISFMKKIKI